MFNDYANKKVIDRILANQESVFGHFLGSLPSYGPRYHSPFRSDGNPGCRFDKFKGVWYFIDNAGHNGRLQFDCIHFVAALYECSYSEAVREILDNVELIESSYDPIDKLDFKIRYLYQQLPEDNYFTREGDLPIDYLDSQHVKYVDKYWCNTKNNHNMHLNPFHNPKRCEIFAYGVNGRTELYCPGMDPKSIKNTKASDYYGEVEGDEIFVVEGNKDRMMLHYHLGVPVVGIQNVQIKKLPEELEGKRLNLWLDPDQAGIYNSMRLHKLYPNSKIITNEEFQYDIFDLYTKGMLEEAYASIR